MMDLSWCMEDVSMIKFPMNPLPFSVRYLVQCIRAFLMQYSVHRGLICLTSVILFVKFFPLPKFIKPVNFFFVVPLLICLTT